MAKPEPPSFSIRRITPANAGLLSHVSEDVFDDAISMARLSDYLQAPGHALFVAVAEGVVIGQARGIVHRQPDLPTELYIDNLGVTPAHQRRGVGAQLVRALIAWGRKEESCETVWVVTEADNATARAFYAAIGLEENLLAWFCAPIARA